jgi:hypothetical protein
MKALLTILLLLTGNALAQNTVGYSRTAKRYDRDQIGKISVMPTSLFTNCVIWLTYSANDGTNYYDAAASNDGIGSATSIWTNTVGGAAVFDGGTASARSSNRTGFNSTNCSVSLFAKKTGNGASTHDMFFDSGTNQAGDLFIGFLSHSNTKLSVGRTFIAEDVFCSGGFTNWNHVVVVLSGDSKTIYLNGAWAATTNISYTYGASSYYSLGAERTSDTTTANAYKGLLDDVKVFNRALTSNEVVNLYNLTKGTYGL